MTMSKQIHKLASDSYDTHEAACFIAGAEYSNKLWLAEIDRIKSDNKANGYYLNTMLLDRLRNMVVGDE